MYMTIAIPLLSMLISMNGSESSAAAAVEPTRPRVILYVNRSRNLPAYVDYEDEELIQVESTSGDFECWVKGDLLGIIRLHELSEPHMGSVILWNNRRQNGAILKDGFDSVEMLVNGVPLTLKRDRVSHVVLDPPLEEQYLNRRLALDSADIVSHLALCQWLIDKKQFDHAEAELQQVRRQHNDAESLRLLKIVQAQLQLHGSKPNTPGQDGTNQEAGDASIALPAVPRLLTDDEVNLIRVYEMDLQNPPHMLVPRQTIDALIEQHADSRLIPDTKIEQAQLYKAEPITLVKLLFRLRARELYPQINVISEPAALQLFRERVHDTWLMNSCSTSRCHGGNESGRLRLLRRGADPTRTRYTNMLVLDRFRIADGTPILDWELPGDSLLIQYGLPRNETRTPHPDVPGWKPLFAGSRRDLKNGAISWMESMMKMPRPQYPIDALTDDNDGQSR